MGAQGGGEGAGAGRREESYCSKPTWRGESFEIRICMKAKTLRVGSEFL